MDQYLEHLYIFQEIDILFIPPPHSPYAVTSLGVIIDSKLKTTDEYQFWVPGEPNGLTATDTSAVVMSLEGWRDTSAYNYANTVICTKPSGYVFSSVTGKYYLYHPTSVTRTQAEDVCRKEGGGLATLIGQQGSSIITWVKATYGNPIGYWVDGTDEQNEGIWVFKNGEEEHEDTFLFSWHN